MSAPERGAEGGGMGEAKTCGCFWNAETGYLEPCCVAHESAAVEQAPKSLLRPASKVRQESGCHCRPGQCMAPKIMGRQVPCYDPEKARQRELGAGRKA